MPQKLTPAAQLFPDVSPHHPYLRTMAEEAVNRMFGLAAGFANHTGQHLFITGKAGTGKTTFLKYIKEASFKNLAVVAPTGVAAINAGGVTMHSFFQLPFGIFLPTKQYVSSNTGSEVVNEHTLLKTSASAAIKRQLLQELELLIIDEVSMVRADMLDAIDTVLRSFKRVPNVPFWRRACALHRRSFFSCRRS